MSDMIPDPTNETLKNVEVSPERPIPTTADDPPGRSSQAGPATSAGTPQGAQAVDQPSELVAAADKSAAADARREQQAEKVSEAEQAGFKSRVWTPILSPIVALAAICLIISFLLGLTNSVTAPLIDANTAAAAEEARVALLPEADGFAELPIEVEAPNVTAAYEATNGVGYIIEAYGKGYGGNVPAMIAFDSEGNIKDITFLANSETPGLGTRLVTEPEFAAQFAGQPAQSYTLQDIDALASATISSGAALTAINAAVAFYQEQVLGETPNPDGNADATTGQHEEDAE